MKLAVGGVVIGLLVAVSLGGVLTALLYEVSPTDPTTLVLGSAIFLAVAALASLIPAQRAAHTPPADALRGV